MTFVHAGNMLHRGRRERGRPHRASARRIRRRRKNRLENRRKRRGNCRRSLENAGHTLDRQSRGRQEPSGKVLPTGSGAMSDGAQGCSVGKRTWKKGAFSGAGCTRCRTTTFCNVSERLFNLIFLPGGEKVESRGHHIQGVLYGTLRRDKKRPEKKRLPLD